MRLLDLSAVRFAIVGLANSVSGLLVIYLAKIIGAGEVLSNALGYAFGLILSFNLNKNWTFLYRRSSGGALLRFSLVTAVAYLANLAVVVLLIDGGVNSFVAQACGVPVYAILGYIGYRWFAFPTDAESH